MNPFDLANKHIAVTGASSGLGRYFAGLLAANGARVTLGARRVEAGSKTYTMIDEDHRDFVMDTNVKGALTRMTEIMALEAARYRFRVNALAPANSLQT